MSNILYINNQIVDLDSDIPFPISYSIGDFKNPENRKRNVSKTIKVVGTQNNKSIFAGAYNLSLTDTGSALGFNFNPNVKVKARYIRKGVEIFNGLVRLLNVEINNGNYVFEIVLFADFINIIKGMADINVNELDWKEYDHQLTKTNLENSWSVSVIKNGVPVSNYTGTSPDGFGYWYPVIDFAYQSSVNGSGLITIDIENFVPYVYVKESFEKCFENIGYTIDSSFFNEGMIKALTWGFGGGAKQSNPPLDITKREVEYNFNNSFSDNFIGSQVYNSYFVFVNRVYSLPEFASTSVTDGYSQYDASAGKIIIQSTGSYNLKLDYNAIVGSSFGSLGIRSRVFKNGTLIGVSNSFTFSSSTNFAQITNTNLSLIAGDEITVDFVISGSLSNSSPFTAQVNFDLNNSFNMELTSLNSVYAENDTITLNRFIPNLKCSDFVKGIINMFNLYVSEPNEDGVIKIEPLQNYYEGEENWTDLLDHSKAINIKPSVNDSAKKYNFKFAEDKDFFNQDYFEKTGERYGDYTFESENEYSSNEINYQLPFAQTVPVEIQPNYVLPKIVSIKVDSNGNDVVEPFKGKPRIFFNNGLKFFRGGWGVRGASGITSYSSYPQAHHSFGNIKNSIFDLNFVTPKFVQYQFSHYRNNNLFTKYNRVSILEQTSIDGKILTAYFNLNDNTLGDFSALVNINGVLYRKNLITDYDANGYETTKVELYKVLETTQTQISNPILVVSTPRFNDTGVIKSPSGVGGGTPILSGGVNSDLKENPKMIQL